MKFIGPLGSIDRRLLAFVVAVGLLAGAALVLRGGL